MCKQTFHVQKLLYAIIIRRTDEIINHSRKILQNMKQKHQVLDNQLKRSPRHIYTEQRQHRKDQHELGSKDRLKVYMLAHVFLTIFLSLSLSQLR